MRKTLNRIFAAAFIVLIIIMAMSILDSSLDLSSEYAEEAAQARYDLIIESALNRTDAAYSSRQRQIFLTLQKEHQQAGQNYLLWIGVSQSEYLNAAISQGAFDIDAWLASLDRNTGCPDCQWFSTITYGTEEDGQKTEVCPYCEKILWELAAH